MFSNSQLLTKLHAKFSDGGANKFSDGVVSKKSALEIQDSTPSTKGTSTKAQAQKHKHKHKHKSTSTSTNTSTKAQVQAKVQVQRHQALCFWCKVTYVFYRFTNFNSLGFHTFKQSTPTIYPCKARCNLPR